MKKYLVVLGMLTCLLSFTACSQVKDSSVNSISDEKASSTAEQLITEIDAIVDADQVAEYSQDELLVEVFASWMTAMEDMGPYTGFVTENGVTKQKIVRDGDVVTITTYIKGEKYNGNVIISLTNSPENTPTFISIITTPDLPMGELLKRRAALLPKAGLNVVMGLCVVFSVLILISFIISLMKLINNLEKKIAVKNANSDEKMQAIDNTIAQIIEKEELVDDLELVAVITAAIAASMEVTAGASEEKVSVGGFVVRSIKRANTNNWQKA